MEEDRETPETLEQEAVEALKHVMQSGLSTAGARVRAAQTLLKLAEQRRNDALKSETKTLQAGQLARPPATTPSSWKPPEPHTPLIHPGMVPYGTRREG
jgi:hypothetical protein